MQTLHKSSEPLHLSDEILLIIVGKLNSIDVLFSLVGVSKRLNNVARDRISNSTIRLSRTSSLDCICPLEPSELDRFCSDILPQIRHHIKMLAVECSSMERILVEDYPNLCIIGLINFEHRMFSNYFSGMWLE